MDVATFVKRSGAKDSSRAEYDRVLRVMEGRLGVPLEAATIPQLERLADQLRKEKSGAHRAVLLRMFYRSAKRPEAVDVLRSVRYRRSKRLGPTDILTREEVNRMIHACASLRDKAIVAVAWDTGQRIGAVTSLAVEDVRHVADKKNGKRFLEVYFRHVKIEGQEHSSVLVEASDWLRVYMKARPRRSGPLFPSAVDGGPLGIQGARRMIKRAAKRAGIRKRIYPHLFRHSRTTDLLRRGVSDSMVKKLLGWSPNSNIISNYSHLVDRDAKAALMKAHGLEPLEEPEPVELVHPKAETMEAAMPLVPHVGEAASLASIERLAMKDPKRFVRVLERLLEEAKATL